MASFKKLQTRESANNGASLIVLDAEGNDSGERITVFGVDSDAFRKAERRHRRKLLSFLDGKAGDKKLTESPEYVSFVEKAETELQAALIKDWTFEEPCTEENKLQLLQEAPYIARQVDEFAGKRSNFVKPVPASSSDTSSSSST